MAVDFGTVCRRCGARLLDEVTVTIVVGRLTQDRLADDSTAEHHRLVLCVPCGEVVWPAVREAIRAIEKAKGAA